MAQKMISDFLAPLAANVAMEPQVNLGDAQFEQKPANQHGASQPILGKDL